MCSHMSLDSNLKRCQTGQMDRRRRRHPPPPLDRDRDSVLGMMRMSRFEIRLQEISAVLPPT